MPNKKPQKTTFIQGKRYRDKLDREDYICARVGSDSFALISLSNGNRWEDPGPLNTVGSATYFTRIK